MAEIKAYVSDASGVQMSEGERWHAEVGHPDRAEAPDALIDLTADEAAAVAANALRAVRIRLFGPGEDGEVKDAVVDAKKFDALFKPVGRTAVEVLAEAPVAGKKAKATNGESGRDYATPEWAGTPKKGKTSTEEAEYVRTHFDEVNARLARDGMRTIDLNNAEHVKRYGLEELAAQRAQTPAQ